MEKNIIKNPTLNEEYYHYKHKSGLNILLYPMDKFSSAYALFGTSYGSIDTTFKTNEADEFTTVPEGIAHFLEHKLFESEDGDAFSLFAKTGASANAYTSFDRTCYLFSTTDNFMESLEALMTFVQKPYFTKETVDKEQGIIGQEIQMYQDDPGWRVFFNLLTALYHNNPVKIDIAGTIESIAQIDKDLLYKCYNTFYNLNNMVVCIAGKFDHESAIDLIEKSLVENEKVEIISKVPDEPAEVLQKEVEMNLSVAMPLFQIGYKEAPVTDKSKLLKTQIESELLMSILVGKSSDLYRELYEEALITEDFDGEVFTGRGYFVNIFAGESKQPREVAKRIDKVVQDAKVNGIDEESFTRAKKLMYGSVISMFNSVTGVAHELLSSHFRGDDAYDAIDTIKNVTLEDVNNRLNNTFDNDKMSISIVNPV